MKVLDLSSYQKGINFKLIKALGFEGVILRCITKSGKVDTCFHDFYIQAKDAGLKIGAYTFSYDLSVSDAMHRAALTLHELQGLTLDLGFFLDMEWNVQRQQCEQSMIHLIIYTWYNTIQEHFKFGIYCNLDWYKNVIPESEKKYRFWIARYPSNKSYIIQDEPDSKYDPVYPNVVGWQYTSRMIVGDYYTDCSIWYEDVPKSYGKNVAGLQEYLNDNYDTNLKIDGIYGPLTNQAIIDNLK